MPINRILYLDLSFTNQEFYYNMPTEKSDFIASVKQMMHSFEMYSVLDENSVANGRVSKFSVLWVKRLLCKKKKKKKKYRP